MNYIPPNNDDNSPFKRFLKKCLDEQQDPLDLPIDIVHDDPGQDTPGEDRAEEDPIEDDPGNKEDDNEITPFVPSDWSQCVPPSQCWQEHCPEMVNGCAVNCPEGGGPCEVLPLEHLWRWCIEPGCNCPAGDGGAPASGCWVPYDDETFPIHWGEDGLPYVWRCVEGIGCGYFLLFVVCDPPGSDNCFLGIAGDVMMNRFPCDNPGTPPCGADGFITVYYQWNCNVTPCTIFWSTDPINGPWVPLYDPALWPQSPGEFWQWWPAGPWGTPGTGGPGPHLRPWLPGSGLGLKLTIPLGYDEEWMRENWQFYIDTIWGPFAEWFYQTFGFWPPEQFWPVGNPPWTPPYDPPGGGGDP